MGKKQINSIILFLVGFIVCMSAANARLTIQITQGVSKQTPIAILPFFGASTDTNMTQGGLSAVIQADLTNSGRFDVQNSNFPERISHVGAIQWQKWHVNYIVMGSVSKDENGHYTVKYTLVSRLNNQVFSSREFNHITKAQFRVLAHTISNYIYQAVTGNKGYFTSKISYVDVEHPYDRKNARYQLVVSDYDGFNPHVLLSQPKEPIMSPAWSKDGKYIAYVSYYKGGMAIYTINVYTGVRKLVANYEGINSSPSFSPSGNTLAMALSQGYSENTNIYLMNLKNDKLYKKLSINGINTAPSFSPSGDEIAFVSNRGGNPQIYTTPVDTKYPSAERVTFGIHQAFDPIYTPNGQYIVFMYQKTRNSGTQIAKLDIKTNKITVLTHGKADASPSISPDGNMVLYVKTDAKGNSSLAMVSIDAKVQITLPSNTNGAIQSPAWSQAV